MLVLVLVPVPVLVPPRLPLLLSQPAMRRPMLSWHLLLPVEAVAVAAVAAVAAVQAAGAVAVVAAVRAVLPLPAMV